MNKHAIAYVLLSLCTIADLRAALPPAANADSIDPPAIKTIGQDTTIAPALLDRWLTDRSELAVLDLREKAAFGYSGDPLFAAHVPAPELLQRIDILVPRKQTRVVLVDSGDQSALLIVEALRARGYTAAVALAGGFPAWLASGFKSQFSPAGSAFSAEVVKEKHTPVVTAEELNRLSQTNPNVVVLDPRTVEEYTNFHVPGAISVPGAELVHRFADLVPSSDTLVFVSCAGLPRGIIGAQTLIDAGVPNRVAFLHDGTKGWEQAGLKLEHGLTRRYQAVSPSAVALARERAAQLERRDALRRATPEQLRGWLQPDADRTTYLLDVRTPEEFAAGHLPGAISAPGGQLALGPFRYVGVRGARFVLVDDNGVRATTTAHWLQQRGWEVWIHATERSAAPTRSGDQAISSPPSI
jgi:rhodanese-related sulfurtransferase